MAVRILYFAGITAIVGWSLPETGSVGRRAELAMSTADTGTGDVSDARSTPSTTKARSKVNCAECGVIESMRTIDSREEITGGCEVGDISGMQIPGALLDAGERTDLVTLGDILAGVTAGDRGAKRVRVTTRYQIVVRFRDGTKHVFNENTPGTLRVGERILVIGGTTEANG